MVKAEQRRGNLTPTMLPIPTIAIDGKNVATLRWHDLCRLLDLDPQAACAKQVKKLLAKRFPNVQLCVPQDGLPYALARVHTVTLISPSAACCVYQRPIAGSTNEIGAMPELLLELQGAYGRSQLFQLVTTDAGNTSLKVATMIVEKLRVDYFSQIKVEHGELHAEAARTLGRLGVGQAEATYADNQNGKAVTYQVWRHDLSKAGWLDWTHARQLVRVQRTAEDPGTGERTVGNRFYVSSRRSSALSANDALKLSRGHWRCEEETHWTADAVLGEDQRRLSWSRHANGVFVVSVLRMMALNILAIARKLSRHGRSEETPTWRQVAEHFMLALCASTLNTEAFDAVNE
jgi:predicted transposase YbfD/YdcC